MDQIVDCRVLGISMALLSPDKELDWVGKEALTMCSSMVLERDLEQLRGLEKDT